MTRRTPATMFMEHDDIYQGGGHQYIMLGPKLVEACLDARDKPALSTNYYEYTLDPGSGPPGAREEAVRDHQHCPHGNRGIGQVECRPVPVGNVEIEKIDDVAEGDMKVTITLRLRGHECTGKRRGEQPMKNTQRQVPYENSSPVHVDLRQRGTRTVRSLKSPRSAAR